MTACIDPTALAALSAATPPGQPARLAALRAYSILDTPVEAAFDDITLIASEVCRTPIAVVNLIDETRQWFKSEIGLGVRETPLATSICAHAILEHEFLEIPDTLEDSRFRRNPLVTGAPHLRFYAGALLRTPAGHALGTVCVLDHVPRQLTPAQRDVLFALARQTMAQLELRRAETESRRSLRSYRRLMAVAGHDLRNPLSLVDMALHHVNSVVPMDEEGRKHMLLARNASRELGDTLRRLAEASEMDRERIELVPIDLADFMADVHDCWAHVAQRAGRELRIGDASGTLVSHPQMLRTIIDNFLSNAFKHSPAGPVAVTAARDGPHTTIAVEDQGPGIPPEQQERIFEAFHQLDMRRDGLGLGLSIVRRTAEMLEATVSVESAAGKGTRFIVRVPSSWEHRLGTSVDLPTG